MAYSVLLTSLYTRGENDGVKYYFAKDGERFLYCDAMLSGEASSKYILSRYHIDEIITVGSKTTCDAGDEDRELVLREGKSFFTADVGTLSAYSLLRYRLALYLMELDIESHDILDTFPEEERKKLIRFIKSFFKKEVNRDGTKKFNRLFDALSQDAPLLGVFGSAFAEVFPEAAENPVRYLDWIRGYLFRELKDTLKLEALEGNIGAKIRFIPTRITAEGSLPADNLLKIIDTVRHGGKEDVDLYIGLHGDDVTDTFVLMNILDMVRGMPDMRVNVRAIVTTGITPDAFVNEISDDTKRFAITELLAGTRAFLDYGKVDRIQRYWSEQRTPDPYIESVMNAMRHIDAGISLCDIGDIEKGIKRLKELFAEEAAVPPSETPYYRKLFSLLTEGIKQDYGALLDGDRISFIELVKWAYRKKFYQQTLTIVESRAPQDFVSKGIFYYASTENEREEAVEHFGKAYAAFRPFERYRMRDMSHYFVKSYRRDKMPRFGSGKSRQKGYADFRVSLIDTDDPEYLPAKTAVDDTEALRELLFAYYYLGDVRNVTNHAAAGESDDDMRLIVEEADMSFRMNLITQSVEYFIRCYDRVCAMLPEEPAAVLTVDTGEAARRGSAIRREYERDRDRGESAGEKAEKNG